MPATPPKGETSTDPLLFIYSWIISLLSSLLILILALPISVILVVTFLAFNMLGTQLGENWEHPVNPSQEEAAVTSKEKSVRGSTSPGRLEEYRRMMMMTMTMTMMMMMNMNMKIKIMKIKVMNIKIMKIKHMKINIMKIKIMKNKT